MSNDRVLGALQPILSALGRLDLSAPEAVKRELDRQFPLDGEVASGLRALFTQGTEEGWLCDKEAGGARFSRIAKASEETANFSVDAVRLKGPGVWHRHTTGEIDLCFCSEGNARFDGQPEGWVVFGTGSDHVPTVTGGQMDILYFLPGGALEWKR